ncbi:MAG TPA: hypothetical protein VKJ01_20635, partial [Candidatus Solibacter sp.]|nr:hypothetical protein [Candidatus Solibacter sp.]
MKTTTLALILFLTALDGWAQTPTAGYTPTRRPPMRIRSVNATNNPATTAAPNTAAPFDATAPPVSGSTTAPAASQSGADTMTSSPPEEIIPAGNINFQGVDV